MRMFGNIVCRRAVVESFVVGWCLEDGRGTLDLLEVLCLEGERGTLDLWWNVFRRVVSDGSNLAWKAKLRPTKCGCFLSLVVSVVCNCVGRSCWEL